MSRTELKNRIKALIMTEIALITVKVMIFLLQRKRNIGSRTETEIRKYRRIRRIKVATEIVVTYVILSVFVFLLFSH